MQDKDVLSWSAGFQPADHREATEPGGLEVRAPTAFFNSLGIFARKDSSSLRVFADWKSALHLTFGTVSRLRRDFCSSSARETRALQSQSQRFSSFSTGSSGRDIHNTRKVG